MLLEDNKTRILRLFFEGPMERLHLREIARRVGLSATGAMKILAALEKEGLLKKERDMNTLRYQGNYENEKFKALKKSLNFYALYSCGLISKIADFYNAPEAIILFGSYAKGEDTKESDIDLAIVSTRKGLPSLSAHELTLKRKISIHVIECIKTSEKEFINTLANGVVLYGYLEVL